MDFQIFTQYSVLEKNKLQFKKPFTCGREVIKELHKLTQDFWIVHIIIICGNSTRKNLVTAFFKQDSLCQSQPRWSWQWHNIKKSSHTMLILVFNTDKPRYQPYKFVIFLQVIVWNLFISITSFFFIINIWYCYHK